VEGPATTRAADQALLERDRELDALGALVDGAARGEARIALIEGAAGIGKSRLLAETRRRAAEAGLTVLQARGGELEREFPYGVVRQLLEPALLDPATRERALARAGAPAAAVLDPVEAGGDAAAGDASFAALHGLYWAVVNLSADGPLLLSVDDLHWADRPSLRFLVYVARRIESLPVLLAGSLRPAEPGADAALLGELANDPLTEMVRPASLSVEATAGVVRARLGADADDSFGAACHAATGGNPLLLGELLKALDAEGVKPTAANLRLVEDIGPRAVSRAVLLRLARLPEPTREVARAIAVLGDGADIGAVATLTGIDDAEAAAGTAALARAEILRFEPPLGFVHPLVRAAVYHEIPPGERELRHERAAVALEAAGARAERIAAHLLAVPARGDEARLQVLTNAAEESIRKGAAESAVSYLDRALDETPDQGRRGQILLELGRAETRVNGPAAADHLRQALDLLEEPLDRAQAAAALARTVIFTGSPDEARRLARLAGDNLPEGADDLRLRLEALELFASIFGSEPAQSERLLGYFDNPPEGGTGARMLMGLASWYGSLYGRTAAECAAIALKALEDDHLVEDEGSLMAFPPTIVLVLADHSEALDYWEVIRARLNSRGSLFSAGGVHVWRGHTLWLHGEVEEALEELRAAREVLDLWGDPGEGATYSNSMRANVLLEHGDVDEARALLDRSGYPDGGSERALLWLRARARLLMVEGDHEGALRVLDDAASRLAGRDNPAHPIPWRSQKAQAFDRLGRRDEALELAAEELEVARRWGAQGAVGAALRVLGTIEREDGHERLEEAIATLEGSSARLELAKALVAYGAALRRDRRPTDAREPLRRALELAESCSAPPVVELARTELHAAGVRPRSSALSGPAALTPSERRVADLAAGGQTNRDIAQELFVTPKTVEVHLSNAYRKLGIGSRRGLQAALSGS
jgi:DNA-binding CsgD family transcriptional regulator